MGTASRTIWSDDSARDAVILTVHTMVMSEVSRHLVGLRAAIVLIVLRVASVVRYDTAPSTLVLMRIVCIVAWHCLNYVLVDSFHAIAVATGSSSMVVVDATLG